MAADRPDEWARAIVDELLRRRLLQLRSPSSRQGVEGRLTSLLGQGAASGRAVAELLADDRGVADLTGDDNELAEVLARHAPAAATPGAESSPAPDSAADES